MRKYLLIRILSLVPLLLGISLLAFLLGSFAPGDPATVIAYRLSDIPPSEEQIEAVRREFHLDESLPSRYVRWLGQALSGDLGRSYRTDKPVLSELLTYFPATLQIACAAFVIAISLALPLGIAAAVWRGSWVDDVARLVALLGASVPNYWLAYLLILFFAVWLGWLPVAGQRQSGAAVLPSLVLGLGAAAGMARLMRSSLLEIIGEDFIRTARAKGLPEKTVIARHALKGALIPVITMSGIVFGHLLGGAIIVEQIFAWNGIGKLLVDSIYDRDYPMIQGFVIFTGTVFTVINLLVDLAYPFLDPKAQVAG
jgi:peptide/nickel transport system permease protein